MLDTAKLATAIKHVKEGQKVRPGDLRALCEEALRQVGVQPTERDAEWLKEQVLTDSPARRAA